LENAGIGAWPWIFRYFSMRPSHPSSGKSDLFRERLEAIIDPRHALVLLAGLVPWPRFDDAFGRFYRLIGRPAKPTPMAASSRRPRWLIGRSNEL
jgi:hypothetical protein